MSAQIAELVGTTVLRREADDAYAVRIPDDILHYV